MAVCIVLWDVFKSTTMAWLKNRNHLSHARHMLQNEAAQVQSCFEWAALICRVSQQSQVAVWLQQIVVSLEGIRASV